MGFFITGPAVKNHISPKKGKTINCNISNYVPFVVLVCQRVPPRHLSSPTSSNIFIAGFCDWHGKSNSRKKWENECRELRGNRSHGSAATKIKMKDAKKYKAIYCMTCRTGCRISEKIWSMKVVLQRHGETLRPRIKTLPVLLMNYQ